MVQTNTNSITEQGVSNILDERINHEGKSLFENGPIRIQPKTQRKPKVPQRRTSEQLDDIVYAELKALGSGPILGSILRTSLVKKKTFGKAHASSHLRRMVLNDKLIVGGQNRSQTYQAKNPNDRFSNKNTQMARVLQAAKKQTNSSLAKNLIDICGEINHLTIQTAVLISKRDAITLEIEKIQGI